MEARGPMGPTPLLNLPLNIQRPTILNNRPTDTSERENKYLNYMHLNQFWRVVLRPCSEICMTN